jgi:hypothetical protein
MIREILAFTTYLPLVINVASNPPYLHPIKFYLPTAWTTMYSREELGAYLTVYVEDMNYILAKNTHRVLVFNPEEDIYFTDRDPHDNVVPSCYVCNRLKGHISYDDFVYWLNKIDINKHPRFVQFRNNFSK